MSVFQYALGGAEGVEIERAADGGAHSGVGSWHREMGLCSLACYCVYVGLCVHVYGESLGPSEELQTTAAYALTK